MAISVCSAKTFGDKMLKGRYNTPAGMVYGWPTDITLVNILQYILIADRLGLFRG